MKLFFESYYKDRDDEFEYYLEQNGVDFDLDLPGKYVFHSAGDAKDALRLAKDLGYTSSWRETNILYLVDKGN